MIVANNLKVAGAGFAGDTNVVTLITENGAEEQELMSKEEVAGVILDKIMEKIGQTGGSGATACWEDIQPRPDYS